MTTSFEELKELFSRSHTWMLLEEYATSFTQVAPKKMDFKTLSQAQDVFEHLTEVFEQDLRLGEDTQMTKYVKDAGYESILKSALWFLLKKEHEDPALLIATKAVMITDEEKERAGEW